MANPSSEMAFRPGGAGPSTHNQQQQGQRQDNPGSDDFPIDPDDEPLPGATPGSLAQADLIIRATEVASDGPQPDVSDDEEEQPDDGHVSEEEVDEDEVDTTAMSAAQVKSREAKAQAARERKVKQIMEVVTKMRIGGMAGLIKHWCGKYGSPKYRRHLRVVMHALDATEGTLVSPLLLRKELKKLVGKKYFDRYQPAKSLEEFDLVEMEDVIKKNAPTFYALLWYLLPNSRADQATYTFADKRSRMRKRITMITAQAVHSVAMNKSSWMHKALGIFLVTSGVKRRVVEILNNLGICSSYKVIQICMELNAIAQDQAIERFARDLQTFIVYDNFCRQQKRNEQIVGEVNEQLNWTTSLIAKCTRMPEDGLKKSMLDFTKPLKVKDIMDNIDDDPMGEDTSLFLIEEAINYVFGDEIDELFEKAEEVMRPQWPVGDECLTSRTELFSLPVSPNDESSIAGTYQVQDDIWKKYLKLDPTKDFDSTPEGRLWLVIGDQMTFERGNAVRAECVENSLEYDRKQWLLYVLAWFHILMNCANTVMRTHWQKNKADEHLDHSLLDDIEYWGIKGIASVKPKFFLLQSLLLRSYRTRIVAIFIKEMQDRGYLDLDAIAGEDNQLDAVKKAIKEKLNIERYLEILHSIYDNALAPENWYESEEVSNSWTTMCRMLKEIELFLTVRRAIRYGDIGHMRRAVDQLILPFMGAGQHNYGRDMLHLRWLLSDAATPELQESILATGVISQSGRRGKCVASDEMLEIHNLHYSDDIVHKGNSTHDLQATFRKVSGNREAARVLRAGYERGLGVKGSSSHSAKDTRVDVFTLAIKLNADGLVTKKKFEGDESALSDDIQQAGIEMLQDKIKDLNASNVLLAQGLASTPSDDVFEGQDLDDGGDYGPAEEAAMYEEEEVWVEQGDDGPILYENAELLNQIADAGSSAY